MSCGPLNTNLAFSSLQCIPLVSAWESPPYSWRQKTASLSRCPCFSRSTCLPFSLVTLQFFLLSCLVLSLVGAKILTSHWAPGSTHEWDWNCLGGLNAQGKWNSRSKIETETQSSRQQSEKPVLFYNMQPTPYRKRWYTSYGWPVNHTWSPHSVMQMHLHLLLHCPILFY